MSVIGTEIEPAQMVLVRDRDFKWAFQNLDDNDAPANFPAGDLFFELFTGEEHNAIQRVSVSAATGGTYKLGVGGVLTAPIDYDDVTTAPRDIGGDVKSALQALSTVGTGNVDVQLVSLIPVWTIDITLNTGNNERQLLRFPNGTNGGSFKLGYGNNTTSLIDWTMAIPNSPGPAASVLQTALEGLSGIGSGNVSVTKTGKYDYQIEFISAKSATNMEQVVGYGWGLGYGLTAGVVFPNIQSSTLVPGTSRLSEPLVNAINKTVNDIFNSFETLLGVDLEYTINSQTNVKLKATSLKSYTESDAVAFVVDVTANMIKGALNNIAAFAGLTNTVTVGFYWNHVYDVEFINAKGNQEIPAMTVNTGSLTGSGQQKVKVEVIETGKEPKTIWPFTVSGSVASIKVESEDVNQIPSRTWWQLVFLPLGEEAGGTALSRGSVVIQK